MFLLVSCQQNMLKVTQGTHENDIPGFRSIFVKFRFRNTFPSKKHVFLSQTNVFNQRNQYNSKSVDRAMKFIGLPTNRFTGKKHDHLKRPVVVSLFCDLFFYWRLGSERDLQFREKKQFGKYIGRTSNWSNHKAGSEVRCLAGPHEGYCFVVLGYLRCFGSPARPEHRREYGMPIVHCVAKILKQMSERSI